MKERVTASINEFAKIVGVDHKAVHRAIERGGRLEKSLIVENNRTRIAICDGCVEWVMNKAGGKDHTGKRGEELADDGGDEEMDLSESNRVKRHYEALMEKLKFEREAGQLISIEKYRAEAFMFARSVRDSVLYIPNESETELKHLFMGFLRRNLGDETATTYSKEVDEMGLCFRQFQKSSITKALRDLINEGLGTASLTQGGQ